MSFLGSNAVMYRKGAPCKTEMCHQNVIFLNYLCLRALGLDRTVSGSGLDCCPPICDLWVDGEEWQVNNGDAFWVILLTRWKVSPHIPPQIANWLAC